MGCGISVSGTLNYDENGESYKGEWYNGNKEGYGEYTFSSGDSYKGNWKNSKKHGIGIYTTSKGDRTVGRWENDKIMNIYSYIKNKKIIMEDETTTLDEIACVACKENKIKIVFLPCKHSCCCISCSNKLISCPMCRRDINNRVEFY